MNPFDALKVAQKLQEQMADMQEKLGEMVCTGSAGGGMVQIDMNGKMEVLAVRIAPETLTEVDRELLQDLIKAAFSDATEKVREQLQTEMGSLMGALGLPPGMWGLG
ncbi:MAG TPA: YbaB/EbfC family nucleoid-associated protein [Termitinemataceae bacterium]|jgi:DNA-binding YbaB/EbfC family protein|nr:YbaB/EbfC family nucleoid-associated protein [Termitinemataceae bacterium]HOM23186.1 YbaB/EbfC family nucleoid-associated protein [Termitinemataceae bacterium]HPQ00372.1 YbaB/EbfC family nucleoid-associated protein [Termitinemataceae bacterium]